MKKLKIILGVLLAINSSYSLLISAQPIEKKGQKEDNPNKIIEEIEKGKDKDKFKVFDESFLKKIKGMGFDYEICRIDETTYLILCTYSEFLKIFKDEKNEEGAERKDRNAYIAFIVKKNSNITIPFDHKDKDFLCFKAIDNEDEEEYNLNHIIEHLLYEPYSRDNKKIKMRIINNEFNAITMQSKIEFSLLRGSTKDVYNKEMWEEFFKKLKDPITNDDLRLKKIMDTEVFKKETIDGIKYNFGRVYNEYKNYYLNNYKDYKFKKDKKYSTDDYNKNYKEHIDRSIDVLLGEKNNEGQTLIERIKKQYKKVINPINSLFVINLYEDYDLILKYLDMVISWYDTYKPEELKEIYENIRKEEEEKKEKKRKEKERKEKERKEKKDKEENSKKTESYIKKVYPESIVFNKKQFDEDNNMKNKGKLEDYPYTAIIRWRDIKEKNGVMKQFILKNWDKLCDDLNFYIDQNIMNKIGYKKVILSKRTKYNERPIYELTFYGDNKEQFEDDILKENGKKILNQLAYQMGISYKSYQRNREEALPVYDDDDIIPYLRSDMIYQEITNLRKNPENLLTNEDYFNARFKDETRKLNYIRDELEFNFEKGVKLLRGYTKQDRNTDNYLEKVWFKDGFAKKNWNYYELKTLGEISIMGNLLRDMLSSYNVQEPEILIYEKNEYEDYEEEEKTKDLFWNENRKIIKFKFNTDKLDKTVKFDKGIEEFIMGIILREFITENVWKEGLMYNVYPIINTMADENTKEIRAISLSNGDLLLFTLTSENPDLIIKYFNEKFVNNKREINIESLDEEKYLDYLYRYYRYKFLNSKKYLFNKEDYLISINRIKEQRNFKINRFRYTIHSNFSDIFSNISNNLEINLGDLKNSLNELFDFVENKKVLVESIKKDMHSNLLSLLRLKNIEKNDENSDENYKKNMYNYKVKKQKIKELMKQLSILVGQYNNYINNDKPKNNDKCEDKSERIKNLSKSIKIEIDAIIEKEIQKIEEHNVEILKTIISDVFTDTDYNAKLKTLDEEQQTLKKLIEEQIESKGEVKNVLNLDNIKRIFKNIKLEKVEKVKEDDKVVSYLKKIEENSEIKN